MMKMMLTQKISTYVHGERDSGQEEQDAGRNVHQNTALQKTWERVKDVASDRLQHSKLRNVKHTRRLFGGRKNTAKQQTKERQQQKPIYLPHIGVSKILLHDH